MKDSPVARRLKREGLWREPSKAMAGGAPGDDSIEGRSRRLMRSWCRRFRRHLTRDSRLALEAAIVALAERHAAAAAAMADQPDH